MIILGIIIGLLLAIIVFLAIKRYEVPIERTLKQAENSIRQKGEIYILDEDREDLEAYVNQLPTE